MMVARLDKSLVFTQKTETYAAFLDLEKANNEAWENAISWIIRNRGITHKMQEILYLLKENIKTCITAKFGLTEEMQLGGNRKNFVGATCIDERLKLTVAGIRMRYVYLLV